MKYFNETNNCLDCKYFSAYKHYDEYDYEFECDKHPTYSNLTSFPFNNTKCKDFEDKLNLSSKLPIGLTHT